MRRFQRGFSLIELLVVLAIIAALAGSTVLIVGVAGKAQMKTTTQARINNLGAALEQMKSPDILGAYPPTSTLSLRTPGMKPIKIGEQASQPNETNVGIETLYLAINMKGLAKISLQGFDSDDALTNTDGDEVAELVGTLKRKDFFEYADAWGNPLVYIHSRDYDDLEGMEQYVRMDGETFTVTPRTSGKTGKFYRQNDFQLFSVGPDGEPGTDDDIHYGE